VADLSVITPAGCAMVPSLFQIEALMCKYFYFLNYSLSLLSVHSRIFGPRPAAGYGSFVTVVQMWRCDKFDATWLMEFDFVIDSP
jgi:hypothetical protein